MLRLRSTLSLLSLAVLAATPLGCGGKSKGTFVVVTINRGTAPSGIYKIHLELVFNNQTAARDLTETNNAEVALPTQAVFEIGSGVGPLTITATARNGSNMDLATGSTVVNVVRDESVQATITFGQQMMQVDGGVTPDGGPDVDGAVAIDGAPTIDSGPMADASGPAMLGLDMMTHDFGQGTIGTPSAPVTFTLTNTGGTASSPLQVMVTGADAAAFTISQDGCSGMVLQPGANCTVSIVFTPMSAGVRAATLTVTATGATVTGSLTGTGLTAGALTVTPTTQDYGSAVTATDSADVTYTVRNTGGSPSGMPSVALGGGGAGQFALGTNTCTAALAANATCTVVARFHPTTVGVKMATLTITGSPGGSAVAMLSGTGIAPGALAFSPTSHAFGSFASGGSSTFSFMVTNTGGAATGVLAAAVSGADMGDFRITTNTCTASLPSGGTCMVTITFTADATPGAKVATLTVTATPGGPITAGLSGTTLIPATLAGSPGSNVFPLQDQFTTSTAATWTVRNSGDIATGTVAVTLTGAGAGEYTIVTNNCTTALAPGAMCTVTVVFKPQTAAASSATLTATAAPGGSQTMALSGTVRAAVAINVRLLGTGTGTVTSSPAPPSGDGISCGADCAGLFTAGSTVTLTAATLNGANSVFTGWTGACSGVNKVCTLTASAGQVANATFTLHTANLVFVTSQLFQPNLGSARTYDSRCNTAATAAGINNANGNAYVAFISDANSSAASVMPASSRGWVRPDGLAVTDQVSDLLTRNVIWNPIQVDENGARVPVDDKVLTASNGNGTDVATCDCNNWTSNTTGSLCYGEPGAGPTGWVNTGGIGACGFTGRLYCFETGKSVVLTPPPSVAGKMIYLASGFTIAAGASISNANTFCNAVGNKPSGSASTFKALMSTTTVPAATVLTPATVYVSRAGQLIGTGTEITAGTLHTGVWENGADVFQFNFPRVPTGSPSIGQVGTVAGTCNNWSDPSLGAAVIGTASNAEWFWNFFATQSCGGNYSLYCVEQ